MKVKFYVSTNFIWSDVKEIVDFDDDTSEEKIEEAFQEWVWNKLDAGWWKVDSDDSYEFVIFPPSPEPENGHPEDSMWEWWVSHILTYKIIERGYTDSKQEAFDCISKWCAENLADY